MSQVFGFDAESVKRITKATRQVLGGLGTVNHPSEANPRSDTRYQGQLVTDLAAATSNWTGAKTARFKIYLPDSSSTAENPDFVASDFGEITVVNRNPDFSANAGDRLTIMRLNGEWVPLSLGQSARPGLALTKLNPAPHDSFAHADLRRIVNVPVLPLRTVANVEPPAITNYVLLAPREFLGSFPSGWEFVIHNSITDATTTRLRADCLASELQTELEALLDSETVEVFGRGSAGNPQEPTNPWGTNPPLQWPLGVFFVRDTATDAFELKTLKINKGWRAAGIASDKWLDLELRELRLWPRDVKPLDLEGIVAINTVTSPRELVIYSGQVIQQWDREFE